MTSSPVVPHGGGENAAQHQQQQQHSPKQNSDFSIDHILNRAGNNFQSTSFNCVNFEYRHHQASVANYCEDYEYTPAVPFTWLQCTRYCPPKVPRRREIPQKRQLGRHPRIPFTSHQLAILEDKYRASPYLSSTEVTALSKTLHLADIRVKIWFQNRRARERREKQQAEISTSTTDSIQIKHDSG